MEDYQKSYEEHMEKYGKECKKRLEDDPKFHLSVTPEQAIVILQPSDAPENFYCDGEISNAQALANWQEKLKNSGFNPMYVTMLTVYIFG